VSALAKNLGTDRKSAQEFYNNYFATFPSVAGYIESCKERARTVGYTETYFGRRRYFPQINAGAPFLRAFAERMASNAPIQGTEADILKVAMLLVDEDSCIEYYHKRNGSSVQTIAASGPYSGCAARGFSWARRKPC
jgi:DNA polymerase I-like protein with 3'-5' exonuclease and polymerase domains